MAGGAFWREGGQQQQDLRFSRLTSRPQDWAQSSVDERVGLGITLMVLVLKERCNPRGRGRRRRLVCGVHLRPVYICMC